MLKRFFILLYLLPLVVNALEPPLSAQELITQSTHIFDGRVVSVKAHGDQGQSLPCFTWVGMEAQIKVGQTIKGPKTSAMSLYYRSIEQAGDIECTGPSEPVFQVGNEGRFFVRCVKEKLCSLTHWNGFIPSKNPIKPQ